MAFMIPNKPRDFEPASQEGLMFEALSLLPDDYYVFHSFRISTVKENKIYESETDFVIFNRFKGVLCLEAKSGQVRYENGRWLYGNGIAMHRDGPFAQASSNKYKLIRHIEDKGFVSILDKCKFLHAVWFPSIDRDRLRTMALPSEADRTLILTKEALSDPLQYINRIFEIELPSHKETNLSEEESRCLIREVFCPSFNIVPTASFDTDLKKIVFLRLLKEQAMILNFIDEQRTAAINGAAGTGKTMIAVEKAHRHAATGEKVLFLCYNAYLKNFLQNNYTDNNISYYTIAGLACKLCDSPVADYNKLKQKLEDYYLAGNFPYKHIIIDEGQDFGNDDIEEADIIKLLYDIVIDSNDNGTFYVFYDRLQLIQARQVPEFIENMDCRLTLHKNCRNTENIAITSLKPVTERNPELFDGSVRGVPAKLYYCENADAEKARVDLIIDELSAEGFKDIVILTCKTEAASFMSSFVENSKYRHKYPFTTCRKFKGLEADAIILIDVDRAVFEDENVLIFYVGASRARIKLAITAILADDDCRNILQNTLNYTGKIRRPKRDLASALNAVGIIST